MGLYEKYLEMSKEAEQNVEANELEQARVQVILEKTAQAEELIKESGITEYNNEDIADVVTALINRDIEEEEATEKIAQLYEMGQIMARGFDDEMKAITKEK